MLERFVRYAAAFEKAYASRDFQEIEPFFTEDAVYEIRRPDGKAMRHEGREAMLAYLAWITEAFDRRFEERKIVRIDGPDVGDGTVAVHGTAVYRLASGERCHLTLTEVAHFRGDRIERLVDTIAPGAWYEMQWIVGAHPERFPEDPMAPGPAA